jgi:hypothetical protein
MPRAGLLKFPTGSRGIAGIIVHKAGYQYYMVKLGFDDTLNPVSLFGGPLWEYGSTCYFNDNDILNVNMEAEMVASQQLYALERR